MKKYDDGDDDGGDVDAGDDGCGDVDDDGDNVEPASPRRRSLPPVVPASAGHHLTNVTIYNLEKNLQIIPGADADMMFLILLTYILDIPENGEGCWVV